MRTLSHHWKPSMITRFSRTSIAGILAGIALLVLQPGQVQAHPQLAGRWVSKSPPNVNMSYEFALGEYRGAGVWRGTFTVFWGGQPISWGEYELRIFSATQGTLSLRDGYVANIEVANVDLGTRIMVFKNVTYSP